MALRILIHAPDLETIGGKQSYFLAVRDHFTHEVDFFTYGARGKNESKLYTLWRMLRDYVQFFRELKRGKYDLLHLNPSLNRNSFYRDSIFMLLARLAGVKTVVFWHGWNWGFARKSLPRIMGLFRASYGKAAAMIVLASEFETELRRMQVSCPIYRESTVVDNYLVDGVDADVIKEKFSIPAPLNLLFLARVEAAKGIFECLEAYHNLKPQYPQLRLYIAGKGNALPAVKAWVAERKLSDVHFLGFINGSEKIKAFHQAHLYLFPSTYGEGLPCSVLEAMGVGLPVITTDVGGIKDFFQPADMGAYLPQVTGEAVALEIEAFLADPARMQQVGQYNHQYAHQHFAAPIVAQRIEHIYEALSDTHLSIKA